MKFSNIKQLEETWFTQNYYNPCSGAYLSQDKILDEHA